MNVYVLLKTTSDYESCITEIIEVRKSPSSAEESKSRAEEERAAILDQFKTKYPSADKNGDLSEDIINKMSDDEYEEYYDDMKECDFDYNIKYEVKEFELKQ